MNKRKPLPEDDTTWAKWKVNRLLADLLIDAADSMIQERIAQEKLRRAWEQGEGRTSKPPKKEPPP